MVSWRPRFVGPMSSTSTHHARCRQRSKFSLPDWSFRFLPVPWEGHSVEHRGVLVVDALAFAVQETCRWLALDLDSFRVRVVGPVRWDI